MVSPRIPGYAFIGILLVATPAFARVVISEVMWMGSDLSTADEWVELTCTEGECPQTLSGWALTSLGSDGTEKTLVRFGEVTIGAGQYAVVSNYSAADSRLATNPVLTTTAMTLPNTKLLLRLRDGSGNIMDEVDDGVGVPFAGDNPSGTGAKASMERLDLSAAGNVKDNWQTALLSLGFDSGLPIFGTPGFPRTASSSSSWIFSSSSSSSASPSPKNSSSASEVGSVSSGSSASSSSSSSSPSSSCAADVANPRIAIQSGEPRGEGKVTINLQLLWEGKGTLRCAWEYGDGFASASCNPPSHTFDVPGTYDVRVNAEDACGGKTLHVLPIEVVAQRETAWRAAGSSSSALPRLARVVRVIDGDTVEIIADGKMETVRLLGIDAPEVRQGGEEEKKVGIAAREALRGLLDGAVVELTFDEERMDAYGRTLAYLAIRGHDVQAELLRRGLAEVYRKCRCARKEEYFRIEDDARKRGVGMWGAAGGVKGKKGAEGTEVHDGSPSSYTFATSVPSVPSSPSIPPLVVANNTTIFLSEIYPVPLPAEEEWVELWNGGEEPVDLSGWTLDDAEDGGSTAWTFPDGFVVPAGAFILLRQSQTRLALNNGGDAVALIAPGGKTADHIAYGKLRRGRAYARVIQRIGNTGGFRALDRFCVTDHPTPFERNVCEALLGERERGRVPTAERVILSSSKDDTHTVTTSPKVRRVVRIARRVRYRDVIPPAASGGISAPDPLLAAIRERMDRSVQSGQVMWGEDGASGMGKNMVEWEAMLLPFLLIAGAHGVLTGMRKSVNL